MTQVPIQLDKGSKKLFPYPFLLQKIEDLEDKDDVVAEIPELEDYFSKLRPITIRSKNVTNIPIESFEEVKSKLEEELNFMKKNNETMKQQTKEYRTYLMQQQKDMKREEQEKHKNWKKTQQKELKDKKLQLKHKEEIQKLEFFHEEKMKKMELMHKKNMKDIENSQPILTLSLIHI